MSLWYRVHTKADIDHVFSGDGGLFVSGRWHHQGNKVVYCSDSIALATVEWLSHNGLSVSGFSYHKFSIEVPDDLVLDCKIKDLPDDWFATPSTDLTRDFADLHLFKKSGPLAIKVPSAVIPEECNLVVNRLHEGFESVAKSIRHIGRYNAPNRA